MEFDACGDWKASVELVKASPEDLKEMATRCGGCKDLTCMRFTRKVKVVYRSRWVYVVSEEGRCTSRPAR